MNKKSFIILFLVLVTFVIISVFLGKACIELEDELFLIQEQLHQLKQKNEELKETINELRTQQTGVFNKMEDWLDEWNVENAEVTGYAPLDPNAKEGICYSGNPNITSSGEKVIIGETAAAGTELPLGTRIWIKGYGFRKITDRGGMVNRNPDGLKQIDIAVKTQKEAYKMGRGIIRTVVKKQ